MKKQEKFYWGAASSAYQIEGATAEDGKGPSIWDVFSHQEGTICRGHTGDIACDSYHRLEEDLDLLKQLSIPNYRFSISWPRIFPNGDGELNPVGLKYYDRVVDGCLARGITPWVTLFHWDLPQSLQERFGGWQGRETAIAFGRYASAVAKHFRGRVKHYFVFNEPQCFFGMGYGGVGHAPGLHLSDEALFRCWHNMLLAYGWGAEAVRQADPDAAVGVASTGRLCYPATDAAADVEAAREASFSTTDETWKFCNQMFLDPICLGHYPECSGSAIEPLIDALPWEELNQIHQEPDFIGLNIYHGERYRADETGTPVRMEEPEGFPRTALKWPISPEILTYGPLFVGERYGLPIYISENGLSCNDKIYLDGKVHDGERIDFLQRYLNCLKRGIELGAPVRGYFHWSLTDNFERSSGYDERFGLIYVDYTTQRRIPKDSAWWYSNLICNGGRNEEKRLEAPKRKTE